MIGLMISWDVVFASVIKWNFIINWHVKGLTVDTTLKRKYFIYWKFTTRDSFSDLEKVFTWRCNFDGNDTNSKKCLPGNYSPYSSAALTIIDQNYDSPLFK